MQDKNSKPTIALVVPAFNLGGGVPAVAQFLYRVLNESGRYTPHIISLAMSSRDAYSIRLLAPRTWSSRLQLVTDTWNGIPFSHMGAVWAELEFQRYQPRRALTDHLNQYDLVQVVAGTPAWAFVARNVHKPICLFIASMIQMERVAILQRQTGWKRLWMRPMTIINARLEQAALKRMSYVFAESEYTRRLVIPFCSHEAVGVAPPGIDTTLFTPATYQPDSYILSVGRFSDHRKNVRLLFAAYARLRQQCPAAPRLVLVGTAPSLQDMAHAAALGLTSWIDIYENVSIQALADYYRNASLFVLASDEEGLGIVILEAMASGLPVVSTRCGGPETAVSEGETGYLTPVCNAEALATAMQKLLEDPELRQQMGQRGRQIAEERFSLAAAGKVYLDRYDQLLAAKRER